MRVRANGAELEEEPLFWDCVVYSIPAEATEVAFDVDVVGRSFRSTLPRVLARRRRPHGVPGRPRLRRRASGAGLW
ncbi:MAG: hypothetical protein M5U28_54960 [Sandaracinaceae bacterium]|nr:hypothetical protein [Sandaracinaceae bacterium]